ncbi:MAG: flavin monoamine oxidase family protein [Planctomycetia bacterium]|nr:flavin monoamine oxidase family protein [Planctomycetia bacterium]
MAVIGAGLAGLCAARQLVRQGLRCVVLEARDRVGGRTLSQSLGRDVIDLGGQWIGARQHRLSALAAELGVERCPQYDTGTKMLSWGGRIQRYDSDLPRLSLLAQLELLWASKRLARFSRELPPAAPWTAPRARDWDSITLETWKRRNMRSGGARLFLDIVTRAVFTSEPRDLSFLYFLNYLRSGQGLESLISIRGGAQQERFVGGAQQISCRLADQLAGRVILNAPVRSIEQHDDGVVVHSDAGRFAARRAIVAVPPVLAGRIHYQSALPAARDQLTARMPMGSVIKYIACYERAFWREAGLSGEAFSDTGPTVTTFDDTSHDGAQPALVSFSDGEMARVWGALAPEDRRAAVLAEFARFFGPQALKPTDFVEKNWNDDPWSRGCYVGVTGPGTLTSFGEALRRPCGRIHWSGTETADQWLGYMDGAIQSGERAAEEVAARLRGEQPAVASAASTAP